MHMTNVTTTGMQNHAQFMSGFEHTWKQQQHGNISNPCITFWLSCLPASQWKSAVANPHTLSEVVNMGLRCGECVCSRCVQYVCVCVCVCLRAYSVWVGVCVLCSTIRGSCSNFQVFNVYSRCTMWLLAAESSMVVLRFLPQIRLQRGRIQGGVRTRGLYVCWGCSGSTSAIKKSSESSDWCMEINTLWEGS